MRPYVVEQVVDSSGNVVEQNAPTIVEELDISPSTTLALRRALATVVNDPKGTAAAAFDDFGLGRGEVGGKTGTAEVIRAVEGNRFREDQDSVDTALFVGVAPLSSPEYVVVIVIERGGSGGAIAAAAAKPVLQYLLNGEDAVRAVVKGEVSE